MPVFTITLDLRDKETHDYKPFVEELRKQKCYQLQGTVWLGAFSNNANQLHKHFKPLLGANDGLFIAELIQHFAYSGAAKGASKWLELNRPREFGATAEKKSPAPKSVQKAAAEKAPAKAKPAAKAPAKAAPAKKAK